jgi:hypothetical protein
MGPDEGVVLTVVSGEPEADVVCGLLRSAGIYCAYRDTEAMTRLWRSSPRLVRGRFSCGHLTWMLPASS